MMQEEGGYDFTTMTSAMVHNMEHDELIQFSSEALTVIHELQKQVKTTVEEKTRLSKNINMAVAKLKELKKENEDLKRNVSASTQAESVSSAGRDYKNSEEVLKLKQENEKLTNENINTNEKMKQLIDKVKFKLKQKDEELEKKLSEFSAVHESEVLQLRASLETTNGLASEHSLNLEQKVTELELKCREYENSLQISQENAKVTQARCEALDAEKDSLVKERHALMDERDGITKEFDALKSELNSVKVEMDAVIADRNAAVGERDAAISERNAITSTLDVMKLDLQTVTAARDEAVRHKERQTVELDAAISERNEALSKQQSLIVDVESVSKERDAATAKMKKAVKRIKELKEMKDGESKSEVETMQRELGQKEDRVAELEALLNDSESRAHRIIAENEENEVKLCTLKEQLKNREIELQHVLSDLSKVQDRLSVGSDLNKSESMESNVTKSVSELVGELERKHREAISERDAAVNQAQKATLRVSSLHETQAECERLQGRLDEKENEIDKVKSDYESVKDSLESVQFEKNNIEASLGDLKNKFKEQSMQLSSCELKLNDAERDHNEALITLTEKITALTKERDGAKEKAKQAIKRGKELKSADNDAREREVAVETALRNELAASQQDLLDRSNELEELRIEFEKQGTRLADNECLINQIREDYKLLEDKSVASNTAHSEELERLTGEVMTLSQERDVLRRELNMEQELAAQKQAELTKRLELAEKQVDDINDGIEANSSDREKEINSLRSELKCCKEELTDRQHEVVHLQEEIEDLTLKITESNQLVSDSRNVVEELTDKVELLAKEKAGLLTTKDALAKKITDVENERENDKGKLTKVITKLRELKSQLDTKAVECASLSEAKATALENLLAKTSELNLIKDETSRLQQQLADSQESRSSVSAKTLKLNAMLDAKTAEIERLADSEQGLKKEMKKMHDNMKDLESACTSQREEIKILLSDIKKLTDEKCAWESRSAPPKDFEVKLRCEAEDGVVWCLIADKLDAMNTKNAEQSTCDSSLQWQTDEKVLQWISEKDVAAEGGFSIEEEIELPPTIQESMLEVFRDEKQLLLDKISKLSSELDSSQKSFDAYRERSRSSLKNSASNQKIADEKVLSLTKELKFERVRLQRIEASAAQRNEHLITVLHEIRHQVQTEKTQLASLQHQLGESQNKLLKLQDDYDEYRNQEEAKAQDLDVNKEDSVPLSDVEVIRSELSELKESYYALKQKEVKLMQEIKKRGDLARHLCSEKDEEIKNLREKLHYDQKLQSGSFGNDGRKSPIKHGLERRHSKDQAEMNEILPSSGSTGTLSEGNSSNEKNDVTNEVKSDFSNEDDEKGDFQILLNLARFQAQRDIQSGDPAAHFQQSLQRLVDSNQELRAEIERLQEREKRRLDMNMSGYAPLSPTSQSSLKRDDSQEQVDASLPAKHSQDAFEEAREQRLSYLRNAFSRFVQAKDAVEVQNIGRVICTILNFSNEEQEIVNAAIMRFSPAIVASSTIDNFSTTVSSFFNF